MKRLLALLVTACLLTMLLPIYASAAFKDDSSIQHKEAVQALTGKGIITGFEDNTFQPKGTLTRTQACAILARNDLGNISLNGTADFRDVSKSYWGTGYIAYCVEKGYAAGYGDGTFGPEDMLTGVQWSKMVLTQMGYDAVAEGMIGSQWDSAVTRLATKEDLFNGLRDFDGSAPISRDDACQILFNGMNAGSASASAPTPSKTSAYDFLVSQAKEKGTFGEDSYTYFFAESSETGFISFVDYEPATDTLLLSQIWFSDSNSNYHTYLQIEIPSNLKSPYTIGIVITDPGGGEATAIGTMPASTWTPDKASVDLTIRYSDDYGFDVDEIPMMTNLDILALLGAAAVDLLQPAGYTLGDLGFDAMAKITIH